MDESRIKVGTKIKIINSNSDFYKIGDVGTIIAGTSYHSKGKVKDYDGWYWVHFPDHTFDKVCVGDAGSFKILKY